MNKKYALLIFLPVYILFLSCARQDQDNEADFRFYFTNDKTGIIIETFLGQQESLAIPGKIQNLPVAKIGRRAFYGLDRESRLTSVIIPDSVTVIERNAFSHNLLENVTIGSNVAVIEDGAFLNNRLVSISIPDSVIAIDIMAFMRNRLASINIPASVLFIGVGAFMDNHLTEAVISNGVVHIGNAAFAINQLASITIPDSVTRIEPFAFETNPLTWISIGADVTLGDYNELAGTFMPSFDRGFDAFYLAHGRRAGIYTYTNGAWSVDFR